ncbi:hypothetical protein EIP86_004177 [Pleurotus ostreatoroseus]|nr:hypothetical protein EIP86_004177 [Pleurotus ostreatoroseus]
MARCLAGGLEGGVRGEAEGARGDRQPDHAEALRWRGRCSWCWLPRRCSRRLPWRCSRRRIRGGPERRGGRLNAPFACLLSL